ncbi:MAG: hypothetical protein H6981_14890 [Gammaproteobacteria bacterium]|nr:hypothetical protein [Gammaproteobacteria bacterium]MCP5138071.1 hypothetical protein [Gammaproteobacteria bacterium]
MSFPSLASPSWPDTHAALCAYASLAAAIKASLCGDADLECTTEGISTGPIAAGDQVFELCLALNAGQWRIRFADGAEWHRALVGQSVVELAEETFLLLETQAAQLEIEAEPEEADAEPLHFDREAASAWFQAAVRVTAIFRQAGGTSWLNPDALTLSLQRDGEEIGVFHAANGELHAQDARLDYNELRHAEDPSDVLAHWFDDLMSVG